MGQKEKPKDDVYMKRMRLYAQQMDILSELELSQLHRIGLLNRTYKVNQQHQHNEIDQFINNQLLFLEKNNVNEQLNVNGVPGPLHSRGGS